MDTTIERVIFLQGIELFSDIPSEQLAHLAGITKKMTAEAGEELYHENDPSHSLYLLVDGKLHLTRNGKLRKELTESAAFGVWGFFDEGPRLTSATCVEESYLLRIDNFDFFDLMEERVHLSRGLLKYFVKRVRKLIEVSDVIV